MSPRSPRRSPLVLPCPLTNLATSHVARSSCANQAECRWD
jgi:hypothetical protein